MHAIFEMYPEEAVTVLANQADNATADITNLLIV